MRPNIRIDPARRPGRAWLMRAMTVAISLLPFVAIEFALRHFAPEPADAETIAALTEVEDQPPLFVLNEQGDRWEIPSERFNFFRPASFLADKPDDGRRIFVIGGSTVQGRPFSTETSFPTWLRLRLEAADPDTPWEVVNCGGVSYASYRVAILLDEVLNHDPDAIILYTGHNEFLEDREYAGLREMTDTRKWFSRMASKIRTVTWLRSKFTPAPTEAAKVVGEVNTRLDHVGGLERYQRDDRNRRTIEHAFSQSLAMMIRRVQDAGLPLVLCVPASDLVNTPPFKAETDAKLTPAQLDDFRLAWATLADSNAEASDRLQAAESCLQIDPQHASANYIAGRLQFELGHASEAQPFLTAARDYDVCPLRATSPIIQSVIEQSIQHEIPLIRTDHDFDQRNHISHPVPDGLADPEMFLDHVHPTIAGHQLIGERIAIVLERLGWVSNDDGAQSRYDQLSQEHLARLGEEYYARGKQRLEGLRRWAAGRAGEPHQSPPVQNPIE